MDDRPSRPESGAVAAIDLGSNSIKLTVARPTATGIAEFAWDLETVRLGRGLDETGRLADDRIEAALATLRRFARAAADLGATRTIGVATEAVRAAANGPAFLQRVREETGVAIEVVSGAREAALTFAGLDPTIDRSGSLVVADIGGASTEVIVAADGIVERADSVPIGSGRSTDRFVVDDPPTAVELGAVRDAAEAALAERLALHPLPRGGEVRLVLVGGTGEYLGVLAEEVGGLSAPAIDAVMRQLLTVPSPALAARLEVAEARARVLPAGAAIARAIANAIDPAAVLAARSGIRRGLLLEAFGGGAASGEPPTGS